MSASRREEGNAHFREKRYFEAHECYIKAIDECPKSDTDLLSILFSNLSATQLALGRAKESIASATQAIVYNEANIKAYFRRASASSECQDWKAAHKDFQAAIKLNPDSSYLHTALSKCQKQLRIQAVRSALSSEQIGADDWTETHNFTSEYATDVTRAMCDGRRPPRSTFAALVRGVADLYGSMPNVVEVDDCERLRVVGDTHGQFNDVIGIFERFGFPSRANAYLFNGNFMNIGTMSVETLIALFAWKLADPQSMYINRGSHETGVMMSSHGFVDECKEKYDSEIVAAVSDALNTLPIGHVINHKVIVVHGGIWSDETVSMSDLQRLHRKSEPPESGPISDILWSNPSDDPGFTPSPRCVAPAFGPDVTARFLTSNGLRLLVRSHEWQEDGYSLRHNGKCITVFSAPSMGSKGAILSIEFGDDDGELRTQFDQFGEPERASA